MCYHSSGQKEMDSSRTETDLSTTTKRRTEAVFKLLERKRSGTELDQGEKIPAISAFIESELARWENSEISKSIVAPAGTNLDGNRLTSPPPNRDQASGWLIR